MKALAEIIEISPEMRSTNLKGEQVSRFVITFQIGLDVLHHTLFKKTANLERYPISTDGFVKGAIGNLEYGIESRIAYSQKDGLPYVNYQLKDVRWTAKTFNDPARESQSTALEAHLSATQEAVQVAAPAAEESGMPF